ncbi:MAG TPA: hypothetical protein PKY82_02285 [Pyrinomonadaceae bacterium]|nr:hypothetical protein [Pyrinomonadaceae bacterium]
MTEISCKICHPSVKVFDVEKALTCFERGDYEQAYELALPLAENGNVVAQCMVGSLLQVGFGTQADDLAAEKWLTCAGEKGCGLAWHNLSTLYLTGGKTLSPNSDKARECRDKAIKNGFNWGYEDL